MNVTVENLAPCRKLLRIEIDPQAVDAAFEKAALEYQRHVRLPGFRIGKAPRHMVEKTYVKEIADEAKRKLISDHYKQALEEQKIEVVQNLDVEEIQFGKGQPLLFTTTVETAPEFEVPEYRGLSVQRLEPVVTEEDVQQAVDVLRRQAVRYDDVARPAQPGDFVVVNYTGTTGGKPLTEIAPTARGLTQKDQFWMRIAPDSFIPGFTEQIIGHQAGDNFTVSVVFPADFVAPQLSGLPGEYEVQLVQVKVEALPEVTDEFASKFGAENVAVLMEGVRKDLASQLDYSRRQDTRNQIINALLKRVRVDLPDSMVDHATRKAVYEIVRENQQRGVTKEIIEQQKDQIYKVAQNQARVRVTAGFILRRIAEKEGITVSNDELGHRIGVLAAQSQTPVETMVRQLKERNALPEIHEEILAVKVLDFIEQHAQIQELSQEEFERLRGAQEAAAS